MLIGLASAVLILAIAVFVLSQAVGRKKRGARAMSPASDEELRPRAEALTHTELARLRALDWMLGGVAHDLNNALSVVLMNLDVMQQDPAVATKHGRRLDGMFDSMAGASSLVRHLLNFSHSRRPAPEVVSLAETLPPLIELVQAALGRDIAVKLAPSDAGPCCTIVDQASFEVAIVHLALQLGSTMRHGGELIFDLAAEAATPGSGASESVVLSIAGVPGADAAHDNERGALDLEMAEVFARHAQGTLSVTATQAGERAVLRLPSCPATTTV